MRLSIRRFLHQYRFYFLLAIILSLGVFFRTYDLIGRMGFDHDADLFSWIVKDIVVNHHFRLIGQLTSADGIFIGPLFYYLLIPFFFLAKMDPIGAVIPITVIGILTVCSYYWVFARLFTRSTGLIAALLEGNLIDFVYFDRRVVPSTPTNLWVIWYFYTVINIARGNFSVLPLLGVLIGLIWHIHIALFPALIAVPLAWVVARKMPTIKQIFWFFASASMTSVPFLLFEVRHNFSQTLSLIQNFTTQHGGGVGVDKLNLIIIKLAQILESMFFAPWTIPWLDFRLILAILLLSTYGLIKLKVLNFKEVLVLAAWIIGVVLFYTFSSTIISEYYFANIFVIFIAVVSFWLAYFLNNSRTWTYLISLLLILLVIKNIYYFVTIDVYHKGYVERKAIAQFIAQDAKAKGYPCVAVNYITSPGENVGFRYFFWLDGLHVNQPWSGSPVYNIVIPAEYAQEPVKFGHIGVIPPSEYKLPAEIQQSCSGQDSNLTDPMFGYTE
ncbi:MAG: hypothetical protein M1607_02255 [Patescibacteria group bacterium]|nr:hypothetical protein [Patescibacteria group bacterium]